MKRVAAYVLTTGLVIGILYQRDLASQINTVKELAPGVYSTKATCARRGTATTAGWSSTTTSSCSTPTSPRARRRFSPRSTRRRASRSGSRSTRTTTAITPTATRSGSTTAPSRSPTRTSSPRCGSTRPGCLAASPDAGRTEAKQREDLKATRLKAPSLLYKDLMIFDDGKHRVELRHFGLGHTQGDALRLAAEGEDPLHRRRRVNGPFNYMGDGDSGAWVDTLARVQKLGAAVVAPGHGPSGDAGVLEAQRQLLRGPASGGREEEEPGASPRAGRRARHARRAPQAARHLHRHERQRIPIAGGAGVQRDERQGVSEERGAGRRPPRARAPSRHRSDAVGPTSS